MTAQTTGRKRPKGYCDWRPHKATRELLDQVNEILVEYEGHLPLSVRQIFYRLVAKYGYPKTERAYERLGDKLVRARRAKLIPFSVIRDDGIQGLTDNSYEDPMDFWDSVASWAKGYHRDRQAGQQVRIELWCEAAGMLRQLHRVAAPYSVTVYTAGGFNTLTGVRGIANRALDRNVPTVLLQVGDYDPSGQSIFTSMAEDAASFVEADRVIQTLHIKPVRVALTAEQVEEYDLPTAPPKPTDSRTKEWIGETCQLEALRPNELAPLVEEAIREHLDIERYDRQLELESRDRAEILGLMPGRDDR